MEKLKPCPNVCCPSEPIVRHQGSSCKNAGCVVICASCGWSSAFRRTLAEAIAAWNERPQSEVERLAREVAKRWGLAGNLVVREKWLSLAMDIDALTAAVEADRER